MKVRMRRKAWRPLILGVRSFLYSAEMEYIRKKEEKIKW